ncbi:MAG: hypothetical protein ACRD6W_17335 [Nitrososphaerales archaeon]
MKFWRKAERGIEFVKTYRAHLGPFACIQSSPDGLYLATASAADEYVKVFDVPSVDMINMVKIGFAPSTLCWAYRRSSPALFFVVGDRQSRRLCKYDGRASAAEGEGPVETIESVHADPVLVMEYVEPHDAILSVDAKGIIEYWSVRGESGHGLPFSHVTYRLKSDTDLYALAKCKAVPVSLSLSRDLTKFVVTATDRQIRVFGLQSGKLLRQYDESVPAILTERASSAGKRPSDDRNSDDMEFGARLALERELVRASLMTNAGTHASHGPLLLRLPRILFFSSLLF